MKSTCILSLLTLIVFNSYSQTKKASTSNLIKFGSLAIDKSNGFYYGFSYDFNTRIEAEKKALDECTKKGGNCIVVLTYSGSGCAAYRTIDGNVGTAYGWGVAKTKQGADAMATKECLSRSKGVSPNNFVWSCNSSDKPLEILLNEKFKKKSYDVEMVEVSDGEVTSFRWGMRDKMYHYFPSGIIKVNSFLIGKYEVTQELWESVMGYNPSNVKNCKSCAVNNFSRNEANLFIQKLNSLTEKNYRLPSEKEWVFAAKGGNLSKGYDYAGSNNINEVGWYSDNSDGKIKPVGLKKPNELGIYDMTGNVFEWISELIIYDDNTSSKYYWAIGSAYYSLLESSKLSNTRDFLGGYYIDTKNVEVGLRLSMDK